MNYESAKQIAHTILECWRFRCGEDCPHYDWSPDEGFHCERYKSLNLVEDFFNEALEMFKDREKE